MRSAIHEIRNQLAVAVANVEAFIDGKFVPTQDRLHAVLAALLEVDVLIDDLVPTHPSGTKAKFSNTDVCGIIASELMAMEATAAAAGITLLVDRCHETHPACERFLCDPGQVRQLVTNVMLNALRYTPRGGVVDVDCHRGPGVMTLTISDDGPGVNLSEREAIFEPGVRGSASRDHTGSGTGLAVVKRIVDSHGGTVAVDESDLGGARFVIRLPGTALAGTCESCAQPL